MSVTATKWQTQSNVQGFQNKITEVMGGEPAATRQNCDFDKANVVCTHLLSYMQTGWLIVITGRNLSKHHFSLC